jgi:hypothetical protein
MLRYGDAETEMTKVTSWNNAFATARMSPTLKSQPFGIGMIADIPVVDLK